jgi:NADPH:quinone reductase-like Zn-dependent oxidoreductase
VRAVVLPEFGAAPEVRDLETPTPGADEVLVRVHAASVNGFDLAVANGYMNGMMEHRFPVVLGKDFAGVVEAVGSEVDAFAPGDRVFGVVTKMYLGDGSFGEFVTVPASIGIAKLPDAIDFTTGAALGLAGTAAVDGFDAAEVEPGQTVLVAGATGGVGNQVVQLASKAGAHVIATAHSDLERSKVAELGAAEIVDYTGDVAAQVLAAHPEGVNTVIHLAGDAAALVPTIAAGGTFVSTLLGSPDQIDAAGAKVVPVMATPATHTLERLAENNLSGTTTITVQEVYSLDDATDAFAAFGQGTVGKLVLSIA